MEWRKRDNVWVLVVLLSLVVPAIADSITVAVNPSKYTNDGMTKTALSKVVTKSELLEDDFNEYITQKYNPLASKLMYHCSRIVATGDDEIMLSAESSLKRVYDITPPVEDVKAVSGFVGDESTNLVVISSSFSSSGSSSFSSGR